MGPPEVQLPQNREFTGGDLLAQSLKSLGVEVAFGIHGGHLDAFFMGCSDNGIRLIDTRHETAAVQAAEGYCKVKGTVGVAFVTANSGFANGLPGLASAKADRNSILVITSSAPMADTETNAPQGYIDQIDVARRLTKYADRVPEPEEIPRFVAHAYRIAVAGPPGPVLLDFPCDVLFRPVHQNRIQWGAIGGPIPYLPGPAKPAIKEAVDLWAQATRPVVIIGSGGRNNKTHEQLRNLIGVTQTPLLHGAKYRGFGLVDSRFDAGAARALGALNVMGKPRPDLIILLGCRTGMYLGGRKGGLLPKEGCKYIQVDIDGAEIGRSQPIDCGIVSDLFLALEAMNEEIAGRPSFQAPREWLELVVGLQHRTSPMEDLPLEITPGKMNVYQGVKQFFSCLEPGAIICLDGGESALWGAELVHLAKPHLVLGALGYLVLLGNGFGYSLGAAVADPSRQVVNVQGDGSAGFHISEMDTYARHGLNILTVVVNNYVWAMSIHGQDLFYGDQHPVRCVSRLSPDARYDQVAAGWGAAAAKISRFDEIEAAVRKLSAAQGPACLNLIVDDQPIHPVTRMYMNSDPDPTFINIPYYDKIPRPFYKD